MYYDSYNNNASGTFGSAQSYYGSDFYKVVRSTGGKLPPTGSSGSQSGKR